MTPVGTTLGRRQAAFLSALPVAALLGGLSVYAPIVTALMVVLALLGVLYLAARRFGAAPVGVASAAFSVGIAVPNAVGLLATAVFVAYAVWWTVDAWAKDDRRWTLAALLLSVPAFWLANGLINPNTPSVGVAILGVRKTGFVFVGATLGLLWPYDRRRAEQGIVGLLCLGAVVGIALHVLAPGIEQGLSRGADSYTSVFEGHARMQGVYAGPFHVAMLAAFLLLRAWHIVISNGRRREASVLAVLGLTMLIFANVRTAYITIALGLVLTFCVAASSSRSVSFRLKATGATVALLCLLGGAISLGLLDNAAIDSFATISSDGRALNRIGSWKEAWEFFRQSPLIGQGPGAGASGVDAFFAQAKHVTAHNEVLGLLVEGGIFGCSLVVASVVRGAPSARRTLSASSPAFAGLLALTGFSTGGTVTDAIPVSLFIAMLIGLALGRDSGKRLTITPPIIVVRRQPLLD